MRIFHIAVLALLTSIAANVPTWASPDKLDPRVRVALARVRSGDRTTTMLEQHAAIDPAGRLDVFIEGAISRERLEDAGVIVRTALPGLFTAFIPANRIESVAALPGVTAIRGASSVEPELDLSVPALGVTALRGSGPTFSGVNGAGVLIGVIDSGVDVGHGDFKDAAGKSRLIRVWDQMGVGSASPVDYGYGAEWTNTQIDLGLCFETDDDGHGTQVLGIAGGDGSQTGAGVAAYTYAGVAPKADLVMVKSSFTNSGILDGVKYVFDLATARGQKAVVNLSLGSQFGPHDGTDAFEAGLAAMTGPGRIIVKSAGNDRGSARHAEVSAAGTGTNATMSVAGSAVGRAIQIDGYYESSENMSVKITTPGGTVIGPIARGAKNANFPGTSTTKGNVYLENGVSRTTTGDYEVYCEINVVTGQDMNGTWTLTFVPVTLGQWLGEVDLWRFYNSAGVTANFVTGNQPTEELVSEPGNARDVITVAGWVTKKNWTNCSAQTMSYAPSGGVGALAWFSSPGPTRDGRWKPDIAAPGAAIASAATNDFPLLCAAGSYSANDNMNHVVDFGTSLAAAHVAGLAALLLQTRGNLTPQQIKDYLFANALHDTQTGGGWNKDWGQGRAHLPVSVAPVQDAPPVAALAIQSIAPNPAVSGSTIVYSLPRAALVKVGILDVQGRDVATLAGGPQNAGRHEVRWNGQRAGGARAPTGLYFVVVEAGLERTLQRLVLTR